MKLLLLTLVIVLPLGAAAQNLSGTPTYKAFDRPLLANHVHSDTTLVAANGPAVSSGGPPAAEPDDVCYRIRAFIFRRDDDHVPKLIGSTTCGPRQPRARSATLPEAHFMPLK